MAVRVMVPGLVFAVVKKGVRPIVREVGPLGGEYVGFLPAEGAALDEIRAKLNKVGANCRPALRSGFAEAMMVNEANGETVTVKPYWVGRSDPLPRSRAEFAIELRDYEEAVGHLISAEDYAASLVGAAIRRHPDHTLIICAKPSDAKRVMIWVGQSEPDLDVDRDTRVVAIEHRPAA